MKGEHKIVGVIILVMFLVGIGGFVAGNWVGWKGGVAAANEYHEERMDLFCFCDFQDQPFYENKWPILFQINKTEPDLD